jgi:hypothetical protein
LKLAAALQIAQQFQAIRGGGLVLFRLGRLSDRAPGAGEFRVFRPILGRGGVNQGE